MEAFVKILSSEDFWKFVASAIVAATVWLMGERSKLRWEQYKRKEESYKELLKTIRGFLDKSRDIDLQNKFVDELNNCWLYAPDEVVRAAYDFLDLGNPDVNHSGQEYQEALGKLVVIIRRDMLSKKIVSETSLSNTEYQLISISQRS